MLCNERIMGDLLDRFQLGRASYELKPDEAEVIRAHHPSILERFSDFTKLLRGKRLAVFLDYDGTLTPIVTNPDRAFMSEQMRTAVRKVAGLFPTSIISGRGREKVEGFVQLKELFYAGSHGMDIVGPKANGAQESEQRLAFQPAAKYAPIMDAVYKALTHRVQDIPGASVEHNKFCVSVHFRNCSPDSYDAVVTAVKDTLHSHSNLKASRGRKVLEIQPQVDWGKGKALAHMLNALSLDDCEDVIPIYLGDDRTDEDAFKVLKERATGFGILISNKAKETDAKYTLTDPTEVMAFLTRLVEWGATPENAWHTHHSCTGWSLKHQAPSPPPTQLSDAPSVSYTSTDRQDGCRSHAAPDGTGHSDSSGRQHRDQGQHRQVSPTGSSPGHSPTSISGSAFATVRQFHGLPVAAGTSDRAMPASQWLTKTGAVSQPKPEQAEVPVLAPAQEAAACPEEAAAKHQAANGQPETAESEYSQMDCVKEELSNHDSTEAAAAGAGSIEAEGRPPTVSPAGGDSKGSATGRGTPPTGTAGGRQPGSAEEQEEGSVPPSRSSLDHYLNQTVKSCHGAGHDDAPASHMGQWDNAVTLSTKSPPTKALDMSPGSASRHGVQPRIAAGSARGLPYGKRLTALLLDKLEGHVPHHSATDDDVASPPGISNDSESSLAGYQSPFESLANEAMLEERDSVKAEDGSVRSLQMTPTM